MGPDDVQRKGVGVDFREVGKRVDGLARLVGHADLKACALKVVGEEKAVGAVDAHLIEVLQGRLLKQRAGKHVLRSELPAEVVVPAHLRGVVERAHKVHVRTEGADSKVHLFDLALQLGGDLLAERNEVAIGAFLQILHARLIEIICVGGSGEDGQQGEEQDQFQAHFHRRAAPRSFMPILYHKFNKMHGLCWIFQAFVWNFPNGWVQKYKRLCWIFHCLKGKASI